MSRSKELWETEVEAIYQAFADGQLNRDEAREQLVQKGLDPTDVDEELGKIHADFHAHLKYDL